MLIASLVFYWWGVASAGQPGHFWILIGAIGWNYAAGLWIAAASGTRRKAALFIGVFANLAVLAWFKYSGFIASNLSLADFNPIPVLGISFFVFQGIAYLADIYGGTISATNSLFRFALFKAFFPQLIAGPIVRYQQVAGDFIEDRASVPAFAHGVERFILGLAKKVIIADNLAILVESIWQASNPTAEFAWLGAAAFGLQIYFDFSGYSDMAIGLALMFGVRFPENFNYPYVAVSVQDFWRRWHISLSTWFRDYLYIPLGGSRKGPARTAFNLVCVFALCGLWHGASWSFVIWGLWHGTFLAIERTAFGNLIDRAPQALRHAYVIIVVFIGWTIFRSGDIDKARHMLAAMFGANGWYLGYIPPGIKFDLFEAGVIVLGILFSMPLRKVAERYQAALATEVALAATFMISLACVAAQTHIAFIYFRF
ncbi:MAG: MBOAT family protein [Proteobacteria bacterium]|nr:MBOAT family protein [Pseudomonadota bacterium]